MGSYAKWALGAVALTLSALSLAESDYRTRYPLPTLTPLDGAGVNVRSATLTEADVRNIAKAGFKYVRMDLWWTNVEYFKGRFNFSFWDKVMKWTQANGLRVNFVLNAGNIHYTATSMTPPQSTAAQRAFVQYAVSSVNRYKGRGVLWEILNEPDGSSLTAEQYAELAHRVSQGIRRLAPDEWILGPSISSISNPKALAYLQTCLEKGLLKDVDAVSVHPYNWNAPETMLRAFDGLRAMLAKHGGRGTPILATEWGYPASGLPAALPPSPYQEGGVNLLPESDAFTSWTWKGYYTKPALTAGVKDPTGGFNATRVASADFSTAPDSGFSGLGKLGRLQKDHSYTLSVWLRSTAAPLTIYLGLNDSDKIGFVIDNTWKRYSFTLTNRDKWNQGRMFQIWESTVNNPAWEVYGAQLEDHGYPKSTDLAQSTLGLQGDFLVRSYESCLSAGVPYMVLYEWKESPQAPGCGLNWSDMTPKPAMLAWQRYESKARGSH